MSTSTTRRLVLAVLALLPFLPLSAQDAGKGQALKLTHVSFDISREVVKALSDGFIASLPKNAAPVTIEASHAGSSKQVQALLNGFPAELVTMNQFLDLQNLHDLSKAKEALIPADWTKALPNNASPFASTMVFVVRKGNPKGIKDWSDLDQKGLNIVAPNWKTTGNGRFSWLSAWAWSQSRPGVSREATIAWLARVIGNIPVFANGGRDATNLFDQRQQGDVLLTFEAEARQLQALKPADYQVVTPSYGILTRVYAATIEKVAKANGTSALARAYWDFVFGPAGQEIAARNFFRPNDPSVAKRYKDQLPDLELVEFERVFGNWEQVEKEHFGPGGFYDQAYKLR